MFDPWGESRVPEPERIGMVEFAGIVNVEFGEARTFEGNPEGLRYYENTIHVLNCFSAIRAEGATETDVKVKLEQQAISQKGNAVVNFSIREIAPRNFVGEGRVAIIAFFRDDDASLVLAEYLKRYKIPGGEYPKETYFLSIDKAVESVNRFLNKP